MKKPTVTIGIPAYNEENNIGNLVSQCLAQKFTNAKLIKIIVLSDASTDQTNKIIKNIKNSHVKLTIQKTRQGKPAGINKIFNQSTSDVVVILDADLAILDKYSISRLIQPIIKGKAELTSSLAIHRKPQTLAERVATASNQIWEIAISYPHKKDMYFCSGSNRAFGKKLYKKMKFPNFSADDAFAYLYCQKLNCKFVLVKNTKVIQKVPTTFNDFIKQSLRFIQSQSIQENIFEPSYVNQFYTVTSFHKIKATYYYFPTDPLATILYLFFRVWISLVNKFTHTNTSSKWDIITTTKSII